MKRVWIDLKYQDNTKLVDEVAKVLDKEYENIEVEIIGMSYYDKHLPSNYEIVDYESRDLLVACVDEKVITEPSELEKYQEIMCS